MGGVSGRVESWCLGTASIDDEAVDKIGGDIVDACESIEVNTMVGAWPTPTSGALGGKILESLESLNDNQ